jgi:hypothetical protein
VGFSGTFNGGTRYTYVDAKDSVDKDIRFFDRRLGRSGAIDGLIGGTGSGRDRSHTVNVGPLPLFFTDQTQPPSRRYLSGLGSGKHAVLGTNLNTGGAYPLVG